jgi:hypothetical protein
VRHTYSFGFKLRAANLAFKLVGDPSRLDFSAAVEASANSFRVSLSNVRRWCQQRGELMNHLTTKNGNLVKSFSSRQTLARHFAGPRLCDHPEAEALVFKDIMEIRKSGRPVSGLTIKSRMISAVDDPKFKASDPWLARFAKFHGLSRRVKSNTKHQSVEERLPVIRAFFSRLEVRVGRRGKNPDDENYGRFLDTDRFNVDQVPFSLAEGTRFTYDMIGSRSVRISERHGSHKESRDATLQVCLNMSGDRAYQPPLTVMFRGKGLRLSNAERAAYDPRVKVRFQKKAWYDDEQCLEWATAQFVPFVKRVCPGRGVLLFLDNLSGQTTRAFRHAVGAAGVKLHLFPAGNTDALQLVDRNLGQNIKRRIYNLRDSWLGDHGNWQRWTGAGTPLSASDRRILITGWAATAYESFLDAECGPGGLLRKMALRCGGLLGKNGHNSEHISFEGYTGDFKYTRADAGGLGVGDESDASSGEEDDENDDENEGDGNGEGDADEFVVVDDDDVREPVAMDVGDIDEPSEEELAEMTAEEAEKAVPISNADVTLPPAGFEFDGDLTFGQLSHEDRMNLLVGRTIYVLNMHRRRNDWFIAVVKRRRAPGDAPGDETHAIRFKDARPRGSSEHEMRHLRVRNYMRDYKLLLAL